MSSAAQDQSIAALAALARKAGCRTGKKSSFWRVDFIHKAIGSCVSEQVEATTRSEAVRIARERLGESWEPLEVHRVEVDEDGNHWIAQSWRSSRV